MNLLPTGEVLDKINPEQAPHICNKCNNANIKDSLMHRLNGCPNIRNKFTYRHNNIQNIIRKEIENRFKVPVLSNSTVRYNNQTLQGSSSNLKPDLWYILNGTMHIVEFTIPYGEMKEINDTTISSLEKARKDKTEKYKELVENVIAQFNIDCKLYIVIVSSLGVIPDKTRNAISKILKCNKRECKKISRRLVYEAIRGSFLVFYNVTSDSNIGRSTIQTDNTIGSLNNEEPDSE